MPRPRVFISSVIEGYEAFRDAAAAGICRADCEPVRAEDHPATDASPRNACLDMVGSADAVVLLLGERYGYLTPSGKSATEEEYEEARRGQMPVFAFLEDVPQREAKQEEFVQRVEDYIGGHLRKKFATADELGTLVETAIQAVDLQASGGGEQMAGERLPEILADTPGKRKDIVWLGTAWTSVRSEQVVDPVDLEEGSFQRRLKQIAHECEPALLDYDSAKSTEVDVERLRIVQGDPGAWGRGRDLVCIDVYTSGTLAVWQNVTGLEPSRDYALDFYIEPDTVTSRGASAWSFAAAWWKQVDPYHRYDPLMYQVALCDVGMRRLGDLERSPVGGIPVPAECPENPVYAYAEPQRVAHAALAAPEEEIIRAVTMLRRRFDSWAR